MSARPYSPLHRPSKPHQTMAELVKGYAGLGSQLLERVRLALPRIEQRGSTVARLRFSRGPLTVSGLIVPVVVDALKGRLAGRSLSHILKEALKRLFPGLPMKPSVANRDAKFPVMGVASGIWIGDALDHGAPRTKSERNPAFARVPMKKTIGREQFAPLQCSRNSVAFRAGNRFSLVKAFLPRLTLISAITAAKPLAFQIFASRDQPHVGDKNQPAKAVADFIFSLFLSHRDIIHNRIGM